MFTIPADTALAVRLFWRVGLTAANNSSVYRVLVSTAADRTDTSAYVELYCDTNLLPGWNNMSQRSVSLAAYAGQTIYIAFRNQPVVRRTASLYIDDVEVRATVAPRVTVAADRNTYYNGDTATLVATIEEGILSGLTYTWHSTLLDSTFAAGDTLRILNSVSAGNNFDGSTRFPWLLPMYVTSDKVHFVTYQPCLWQVLKELMK